MKKSVWGTPAAPRVVTASAWEHNNHQNGGGAAAHNNFPVARKATGDFNPPPPPSKALSPAEKENALRLTMLCNQLGVEQRTIDWFTSPNYAYTWPQMIDKIDELHRRKLGQVNVKNPAAWLTKFFNIIRVDPEEPARNR